MQSLVEPVVHDAASTSPAVEADVPEPLSPAALNAPKASPGRHLSRRKLWAIGACAAITVLLLSGLFHSRPPAPPAPVPPATRVFSPADATSTAAPAPPPLTMKASSLTTARQDSASRFSDSAAVVSTAANAPPSPSGPMIARTVSLIIQVKDIAASRSALDAILAQLHGYAADLNIQTPEGAARSFGASLRIPATALDPALAELRKLGRVQSESQSGEEVTQQHTDLVARLKNARETEQRLIAILQQRTGKVSEVLEVEEQISSTRGEIERMEAQLKGLEHRVDYATVQLQLAEEFKAQLNPPSATVGTQLHNAFVAGLSNAGASLLGLLLFFEQYGPVLLVWFAVLGTPLWLVWRRYRRTESRA